MDTELISGEKCVANGNQSTRKSPQSVINVEGKIDRVGGGGGTARRRIPHQPPLCRYGAACRNIDKCKYLHPIVTEGLNDSESPRRSISKTERSSDNNKRKQSSKSHPNEYVPPEPSSSTTPLRTSVAKKSTPNQKTSDKPNKENGPPVRDRSKILCRYRMSCRNKKCPFFHHPAVSINKPDGVTSNDPTPEKAGAQATKRVSGETSPLCRCVSSANQKSEPKRQNKKRDDSLPTHDNSKLSVPLFQPNCPSTPRSLSSSSAKVIFENVGETQLAPTPPGGLNSPSNPVRKVSTKKKCRWGTGCRNKKCGFVHPHHSPPKQNTGGASAEQDNLAAGGGHSSAFDEALNRYDFIDSIATFDTTKSNSVVEEPRDQKNKSETSHLTLRVAVPPILPPSPEKQMASAITTATWHSSRDFFRPDAKMRTSLQSSTQANGACIGTQSPKQSPPPLPPADWLNDNVYSSAPSLRARNATPPKKTSILPPPEHTHRNLIPLSSGAATASSSLHLCHPEQSSQAFTNFFHLRKPIGIATTANTPPSKNNSILNSKDPTPDAEWLFEVLGLNDTNVGNDALTLMQPLENSSRLEVPSPHAQTDTNMKGAQNPLIAVSSDVNSRTTNVTSPEASNIKSNANVGRISAACMNDDINVFTANEKITSMPKHDEKKPTKSCLMSEDEMSSSRRAALELRLESQRNSSTRKSQTCLPTLLRNCRSKQLIVEAALERSMDLSNENEPDSRPDEANALALLELNELLLSSITIAETMQENSKGKEKNKEVIFDNTCNVSESRTKKQNGKESSRNEVGKTNFRPNGVKFHSTSEAANGENQENKKLKIDEIKLAASSEIKSSPKGQEGRSPLMSNSCLPVSESSCSIDNVATERSESFSVEKAISSAQQEKAKMARMLGEARQQAAAARERKKDKKSKKIDKWMKEQEQLKLARAKSWAEKISKEKDYLDLIQKLIVSEFLRQSKSKAMGLTSERVLTDPQAFKIIATKSREAYHALFGELKCRVVVAGMDKKDLNGRQGTLRHWDKQRERFCVGLDTKKAPDSDVRFFLPENLDLSPLSRSAKSKKKISVSGYHISESSLLSYGGVVLGLDFTLSKSDILSIGSAESTEAGLEVFCHLRDEVERGAKKLEESEKRREDEDRRRRAARKAKENEVWKRRRDQMRQEKEEYERMKKEWTKARRENGGSCKYFSSDIYNECCCPRCRLGKTFSSSGGFVFVNIGGIPFRVRFDDFDSEDDDSFFDDFDETWEKQLEEEKEEDNKRQAEILGVTPDADERTIKMAYRKMALKYHPDKWRNDSGHGMTKDEAENRFKIMQSAYDHLMLKFDE